VVTAQIRDIAIIIVAMQSIIIGILLAVLVWQIWRLIKMIQKEIKPIVDDTQETLGTVRGTTAFVSDNVVRPVIRARSFAAGARQAAGALSLTAGRRQKKSKSLSTPPQP
jgi:hypothetical protein